MSASQAAVATVKADAPPLKVGEMVGWFGCFGAGWLVRCFALIWFGFGLGCCGWNFLLIWFGLSRVGSFGQVVCLVLLCDHSAEIILMGRHLRPNRPGAGR